jgi:hypothetical protein
MFAVEVVVKRRRRGSWSRRREQKFIIFFIFVWAQLRLSKWLVDFSMSYKCKRSEDFPMSNVGLLCFSKKKKTKPKKSKNLGKNWFRTLRKFMAYAVRPDRIEDFEQGIQSKLRTEGL